MTDSLELPNPVERKVGLDPTSALLAPMQTPKTDSATTLSNTSESNNDLVTEAVKRLAKLAPIQYGKVRKNEAKVLGVTAGTLDSAVKDARKEDKTDDLPFDEAELWPDPVDGAELLTDITATIRRFIICEPHTSHATALWIVMCWFINVIETAPLALITAPEKRCGKSMLLFLIGRLVPRPLMSSSITPSALFRSIDLWQPTLLIDETDACLKDNEELRGLINCGHTRDSAFTIRCVGEDHTPTKFNVWGAKALAGIGNVADTLMDRSIILDLRRKLPHETVDRIRHAEPGLFNDLSSKLARFAEDNSEKVKSSRPELPPSLNDRAQDNWEPLLAIATVAGGDWLKIGTEAALKLASGESLYLSIGAELLADIQEIFECKKVDRIFSAELVKALVTDDEKRWSSFNRGFPISPTQLSRKLKGYGIHSKSIRIGINNLKGYSKEQFTEAFERYIPTSSYSPSQPVTTSQVSPVVALHVTDIPNVPVVAVTTTVPSVTSCPSRDTCEFDAATLKPAPAVTCDDVTDKKFYLPSDVIDLTGVDFEVTT